MRWRVSSTKPTPLLTSAKRWMRIAAAILLVAIASVGPAHAIDPNERLPDPGLEARARGLSAELRCLVCQNQSIDDSDAPLAKDLRRLVRERLLTGETDAEVKSFVVERYGNFVLLKPPFGWHTLLLWLTPLLVLAAIAAGIARNMRNASNRGMPAGASVLSAEEERRLEAIVGEGARSAHSSQDPSRS